MAKLEPTIGTVTEGGRSSMKEAALTIIEEYLRLVRNYLPASIAEDVVDELRGYIIEAAEEEGAGTLSPESAKRTVARFGAPSEVAEEYRESMLIEEHDARATIESKEIVPPELATPHIDTTDKTDHGYGKPVPLFEGIIQYYILGAIWLFVLSLFAGPFFPIVFGIELGALAILVVLRTFYLLLEGRKLQRASYDTWPEIQRLFTLPHGLLPRPSNFVNNLDLLALVIGIAIFVASPWFWAMIPIMIIRFFYLQKRKNDLDPILFVRNDALVEFITVAAFHINSVIALSWFYANYWYGFTPIAAGFAFVYGFTITLHLISVSGDLWFENMKVESDEMMTSVSSESTASSDEVSSRKVVEEAPFAVEIFEDSPSPTKDSTADSSKEELSEKIPDVLSALKRRSSQTLGRIAGWFTLAAVFASIVVLFGFSTRSSPALLQSLQIIWVGAIGLGFVSWLFTVFYFQWRRMRVRTSGSRTVIGDRGRFESFLDAILMAVALFVIFGAMPIVYEIVFYYREVLFNFSYSLHLIATIISLFAIVTLVLAPLIRFGGDLVGIAVGENNVTNRAIISSGILYVVSVAAIFGMSLAMSNYYYSSYPEFLAIVCFPVIIQIVFSQMKIHRNGLKRKTGKDHPSHSETIPSEDSRREYIPPTQ